MLYLREDAAFAAGGLRILAVAPDPFLERLGRQGSHDYLSIDLSPGKAMAVMDLTSLELPTADRDLIVAFHVLEHIEEDGAAMREIRRVLSPAGRGLIEVPLRGDETDERFMHEPMSVRTEAYGQPDHVRLYGQRDFEDRLRRADLVPEAIVVGERFAGSIARAGLDSEEVFYVVRPGIKSR
jgi:SAM-dependent methyltransferase